MTVTRRHGGEPVKPTQIDRRAVQYLSSDCMADAVQDIDEVARRRHTTEQLDLRKHLHLVAHYVVNTPQVIVLPEIVPSRSRRLSLGTQQRECARIGEKKQFAAIESQYFGQARYSSIGRMAFAGFQVADVWRRRLDATGSILLGEVELPSTLPNDLSETAFSRACHRFYCSFLALSRTEAGEP